jgi:outer membrane murein-binding lipoprotein Lpp
MSELSVNVILIIAIVILGVMLIWEHVSHSKTKWDMDLLAYDNRELSVTADRYRRDMEEAQDIADHAIEVIAEAREMTKGTIREARVNELARAFVDRRRKEKDLQDEIEKMIGGI